MASDSEISVPRLENVLSGLVERMPRFWLRAGRFETKVYRDRLDGLPIDRPVYVCGLARSGSTILLELLAEHADLASNRYRDFPFVAVPIWWNRFQDLAGLRPGTPAERAHKDGILVTSESPEAMEEVLWTQFFSDAHDWTRTNVLDVETRNAAFEDFYRAHLRKLIWVRGGRRYLCKGNYNLTRLGYIRALFPDARIVVPVRAPVGQIASLMKQHRLFCREEARDPRILDHMRRSGHFEFGLDRRPVNVGDGRAAEVAALWRAGDELRGWARYWASLHGFVADALERDPGLRRAVLLLDYDAFCRSPRPSLERLYDHCELEVDAGALDRQTARVAYPTYYRPAFDRAEMAVIKEETADAVARVRAVVPEFSTPGPADPTSPERGG